MVCNINYNNPYFTIEKVSRKKHIRYAFIGEIENKHRNIFDLLKHGKQLSSKDLHILYDKYGDTYKSWINLNSKTSILFIENLININDTIEIVKEKIYTYIGSIINNQQLWFITKHKQYRVMGTLYEKLKNVPIVVQYKSKKLMKDKDDYVVYKGGDIKRKKNKTINENNFVLYDIIQDIEDTHTIYIADIVDEIEYLQSKKVKIKKDVVYGYLNKYWIKGKLKSIEEEKIKDKVKYNWNVSKLLETSNVIKHNFDNCSIIQCYLHLNWYSETPMDLLKIYNKLRLHLSDKVPFIKYKDDEWDVPYTSIYSKNGKSIEEIPRATLEQWLYTDFRKSKVEQTIKSISNSIIIKVYLYTFEDIPRYFTITLDNMGRMHVVISFVHEYNSTLQNLKYAIDQCNSIISNINEVSKSKLKNLSFEIKDDDVILSDNIEISRIYTTIKYKKLNELVLDEMYNMGSIFSQYIIRKNNNKKINSFVVKYTKISNFENMDEIFEAINELFAEKIGELDIINRIEKKFSITSETAGNYLKEWKKKIGVFSTKKNMAKNSGINIVIDDTIKITGAKKFRELFDVYNFITKFLTIYFSRNTYKHDKRYKELIKDSSTYVKNINNQKTIYTANSANIASNINNVFNNSFGSNINSLNNSFSVNDYMNTITEKNSELGNSMAKDVDIEKSLLMTCDEPIESLDVCTDICDDPNYILRRLQRFDNRLFKFRGKDKTGKKIDNYSRKCGKSNERQPIVLQYDPDLDKTINRNSYTYSIKFRSGPDVPYRWYICPRAWDSIEQKPVAYDDITNIKDKRMEKGKMCRVGLGPYGNKVLVNHTGPFDRENTPYPSGFYPGFLKPSSHPDGLCMPCCFEAPQRQKPVYKKCIGEDINGNDGIFIENYVLGIEKFPLEKGRFGIIPIEIGKLLGIYKQEHGYMKDGEECFLRKGISQNKNKSFLYCLVQVLKSISNSQDKSFSKKEVDILIKIIETKLRGNKSLFSSLQFGLLKRLFTIKEKNTTALDNYINYLKDESELMNINFMWDLLQRPGIITPEGLNIVIFNGDNIICPIEPSTFYDNSRKTLFIYKQNNEYEPIYFTRYKGNKMYSSCVFGYNKITEGVFKEINNRCIDYHNTDWKQVLKNNGSYNNKINQLKKQYTLQEIMKTMKIEKNYEIKYQVIDHYYKVIMVKLKCGLIIPVKPTKNVDKYKTIDFYDLNLDTLLTYSETRKQMTKFSKKTGLNISIVYKLLDVNKKNIVNLILNTGAIIPIRKSTNIKDDIITKNMVEFYNANKVIRDNIAFPNDRVEMINKVEFEDETYERMRLLLSKLINDDDSINKSSNNGNKSSKLLIKIKSIMDTSNSLNKKREELIKLIQNAIQNYIYIDKEYIKLDNYRKPHMRQLCHKMKKCNTIHCKEINGKCLLRVMKTNLINGKDNIKFYISNLAEELLRLRFKGNNMIKNRVPTTINTKHINRLQHEILLDSKGALLNINKYYVRKEKYHNNISKNIDYNKTRLYDFNKNNYVIRRDSKSLKYNDIELPSLWKKILKDNYNLFKYRYFEKNTLISSLEYILQKDISNIKDFNNEINNIKHHDIEIKSLCNKLNTNILILESRLTKDNRYGYKLFSEKNLDGYIILFRYKIKDKILYSPIVYKNKPVNLITELIPEIKKYIENNSNNKCKNCEIIKSKKTMETIKSNKPVKLNKTIKMSVIKKKNNKLPKKKIKIKIKK